MSSTLRQSIKEREAEVRAEMAPQVTADVLAAGEKVVAKLDELGAVVAELEALDKRVSEFSYIGSAGIEIFDRSISSRGPVAALTRFFSGYHRQGFDYKQVTERYRGFVADVRSRVK